jgi:hypothetical protein
METKIQDNYIFESAISDVHQDNRKTPFLKKHLSYVVDNQAGNGSYASGSVIFNAETIASPNSWLNWNDAYIEIPYVITLQASVTSTATATTITLCNNFMAGLKNHSLIDSITITQGGRNIVSANTDLAHLSNWKAVNTYSRDFVDKNGATLNYRPDGTHWNTLTTGGLNVQCSTNKLIGTWNTQNYPLTTTGANSSKFSDASQYNEGLWRKGQEQAPQINGITSAVQASLKSELDAVNTVIPLAAADAAQVNTATVNLTANTLVNLLDLHFVQTIRVQDITDYFAKHIELSRGVGYTITVAVNQATTTWTTLGTNQFPFATANMPTTAPITVLSSKATVQPAYVVCGDNSTSAAIVLAPSANLPVSFTLTSGIDSTTNQRLSGCRLYIPGYDLEPSYEQELITKHPQKHMPFMDYYTTTVNNAGTNISVQVASGQANPKAIILMPQISSATASAVSQGMASQTSPFTTCPAVLDPLLTLQNVQIRIGSLPLIDDPVSYNFIQFMEHNGSILGLNGNESNSMSSGLINQANWRNLHRYYAYDLSRYPIENEDRPVQITVNCNNYSGLNIDLKVFLLYGNNTITVDLVRGGLIYA